MRAALSPAAPLVVFIVDVDGPYLDFAVDDGKGIRRYVAKEHGNDDVPEVQGLAILSKGTGNAPERYVVIAARTGTEITVNGFRAGRFIFFHMQVQVDITAQEEVVGRNAAFEPGTGHIGRIRLIIQVHLSLALHGSTKDAGRNFRHIEQAPFIVDLPYDIGKDQGRNVQAVHLQSPVDDRRIQGAADIRRHRRRVVDVEACSERTGIAIAQQQRQVILWRIRFEIQAPADAQGLGFESTGKVAGPQIKGRLALGMDMGRELDIADGKMTTWRFGFDDALVQGDMAVKG